MHVIPRKIRVGSGWLATAFLWGFVFLVTPVDAYAQTLQAQLKITSLAPATVRIELQLPAATNDLSFLNVHAGAIGLGERIENLVAVADGREVSIRKLAPGEYRSEIAFTRVHYDVKVTEPARASQQSHVSWLTKEHGLLMLADLLPRLPQKMGIRETSIKVDVPSGWNLHSNIEGGAPFLTTDYAKGIFMMGTNLRKKTRRVGLRDISVITSGKWPLSDSDALKTVEATIEDYAKVTGYALKSDVVLMLLPFAGEVGPERWTAETRRNAIVLLLGNRGTRKAVSAKLGIILSHEVFHLWVPNALALEGDYDWFFEGFTMYQALRQALRRKLITSGTFLETIARVYDSYLSSPESMRLSLIEASERRWTTASSIVYDKGMIAAFLYDLTLRAATGCRESLDDIYRQLFSRQLAGQGSANEIIINLLTSPQGMNTFAQNYVLGTRRIDLAATLVPYGIEVQTRNLAGKRTQLKLVKAPDKSQQAALRCLGYSGRFK